MLASREGPGGRRRRAHRRAEEGQSLIEMMIALVLGAIIFTAGAGALLGAMKGVSFARENRQAADVFTEVVEGARAADYDTLAVAQDATALAADTRLTQSGGSYYLDPDGAGPLVAEKLVVSPTGSVILTQSRVRDNTPYQVSTYVTEPAGADADYRRLVSWVTWQRGGATHTRQAATLVTTSRVGSSPPSLTIGTNDSFTVNAGATLELPVSIVNRGVRDRWNLTLGAPGRSWNVTWYVDTNDNGVHDTGEDTVMSDASGDGQVDTGLLETDQAINLVGVIPVGADEAGGAVSATITAASARDPGVSKGITHAVSVVSQACPGCTYRILYANNTTGAPADSVIQDRMSLLEPARPAVTLPNYDTDRDAVAGRTLVPGATLATEADLTRRAIWEQQLATETTLRGDVRVRLYVAMRNFDATKVGSLRAYVGHTRSNGTNWTQVGTPATSAALAFGTGFAYVELVVPISTAVTIAQNRRLQVRVISPSSQDSLWLAYGTAAYPAAAHLPVVTG